MLARFFSPSPFTTFYLVFAYILIFSLWWAYLLYEKNETAYKEKVELNQIRFQQMEPDVVYENTPEFHELHSKYIRQRLMIVTEGSVFVLLLLVGLIRVRKVFLDEMKLADQQRNFLLSITHELKSPLSTIKLSLQTMLMRKLEPDKNEKLLNNSLVDLDRLESLVDNILFAAKIERDQPGFSDEEVNVSEISSLVIERFSQNKIEITVQSEIQPEVYLKVDSIGFTSVITNLIENAVKYSEKNSVIKVLLANEGDQVLLKIEDNGIGISDEEKSRVFEKFYRVGNEDTRKTKGTGLGLYIVKRFVEIYKGKISIEDNSPSGSVFKLYFPSIKENL